MDVKGKGIKDVGSITQSASIASQKSSEQSRPKLARSVASAQALTSNTDVKVQVEKRKSSSSTELRSKANSMINSVNVAEEATAEIEKLVRSVDGIVEQASQDETSENRISILEGEARQLVAEIKKQSNVDMQTADVGSLRDDRFRIEQELERSLQSLFQEGANTAFGIQDIDLNQKESIINIRTSVAMAKDRVSELRSKLSEAKNQIQSSVTALEVALENSESATSSVRDVDDALKLANTTGSLIKGEKPDRVVNISRLSTASLELLQ